MVRGLSAGRKVALASATLALVLVPLYGTGTANAVDRMVIGENFANVG
jgi:hypothetical protein